MKALVTGATGFVGSTVVDELLSRGASVRCTVRATSSLEWLDGKPVERVTVDLGREPLPDEALAGVTHVFHIAGVLAGTRELMRRGNVEATRRMVEAVASRGRVKRFVHVSTVAVMGPSEPGRPLTEDAEWKPVSTYGRTKGMGERVAWTLQEQVPVTVIRPPVVYGPRDRGLLPIFQAAKAGVVAFFGRPKELSVVYVGDLARGIVEAGLAEGAAGRSYFLAEKSPAGYVDLMRVAARAVGRRVKCVVRLPGSMLWSLGTWAEAASKRGWAPSLLTRDKVREMLQPAWTCSPDRAERDFGFRSRMGVEAGFAETARWYRERGWLT